MSSSPTEPIIHHNFDPQTSTFTYLVACPSTLHAIVIDSVLDFDPSTSRISTTTADSLLSLIRSKNYTIVKILETHVHADHLTASRYLQTQLTTSTSSNDGEEVNGGIKPEICIGKRIVEVQQVFADKYGIPREEWEGAFDKVFEDEEEFSVGNLKGTVKHLPGHTPDHVGYLVGCKFFCLLFFFFPLPFLPACLPACLFACLGFAKPGLEQHIQSHALCVVSTSMTGSADGIYETANIFCGDSLFDPEVGSARCDFPGGDAHAL